MNNMKGIYQQFEKDNPSHATGFVLEQPDPALVRIAHQGALLTVPAMQAAVWMRTDTITYDQMNQKFAITPQDWAAGQAYEDQLLRLRIVVEFFGGDRG